MSDNDFLINNDTDCMSYGIDGNASDVADEEYIICDDGRYRIYEKYGDDDISTVDDVGNIIVAPSQSMITQGANSSYMLFKMNRYWDGIDLMNMLIKIHYNNPRGKGGDTVNAVNVSYSDSSILFGWLIDKNVSAFDGDVMFEFLAEGANEKRETYTWQSQPNGKITVIKGLPFFPPIEVEENWYTSFVDTLTKYLGDIDGLVGEGI